MVLHEAFFAAATTLDKLKGVPPSFWFKVGGGVLAIIVVVVVFRKMMEVNMFVLGGAVFIAVGLVGFNWLYHRTEPKVLTPFFDRIAPFFPSAGAYQTKQATTPDAGKR